MSARAPALRLRHSVARRLRRPSGPLLFSFNGGAGLRPGTGTELYAREPVFRDVVDRAAPVVRESIGYDPLPAFTDGTPPPTKVENLILLGLVQLGHVELWRDAGVVPDATLGLSLGEAGAVYASGGLGFEDAVRVIVAIGDGSGEDLRWHALLRVQADEAQARAICASSPVPLALAGTIAHDDCTLLSPEAAGDAARAHVESAGARVLHVGRSERATHSPLADTVRRKTAARLAGVVSLPLERPCVLASAGRDVRVDGTFGAQHWSWMHDHPFRYAEACDTAMGLRPATIVQIGATPHTADALEAAMRRHGLRATVVETGRDAPSEHETWLRARRASRRLARPRAAAAVPAIRAADVDVEAPGFIRDPWPVLRALRAEGAVVHLAASDQWLVLDGDLAREMLSRPDEFSSKVWQESVDAVLLGADRDAHAAARRIVTPLLAPGAVEARGDEVQACAEELLRDLAGHWELDAVGDLAIPAVHRALARLLELDEEEALACGRRALRLADPTIDRAEAAFGGLESHAGVGGAMPLPEEESASLVRLLWFAGTVTTVRHLGWAVLELGRRPDLRARVAADRSLLPDLLDEVLRLHPPEMLVHRITTGPVTLGGTAIPADARVNASIAMANRDPARFPDPDSIVLGRAAKGSLTFGSGKHRCPGTRLSRVLAVRILDALLTVLPDWELVQPEHALRMTADWSSNGLADLHISTRA